MVYDYMGYGNIYGGLFDSKIFGEDGLSFKLFFDLESDNIIENLNPSSAKNTVTKIIPQKVNKQKNAVCVNC